MPVAPQENKAPCGPPQQVYGGVKCTGASTNGPQQNVAVLRGAAACFKGHARGAAGRHAERRG